MYLVNVFWLPIGQRGYIDGALFPIALHGWEDLQTVRQLLGKMTNSKLTSLGEMFAASQPTVLTGQLHSTY